MARKTSKPVSIKAVRQKKKQAQPVLCTMLYRKSEGDDWKPDTWKQLWRTLYDAALPYMVEYIHAKERQAA